MNNRTDCFRQQASAAEALTLDRKLQGYDLQYLSPQTIQHFTKHAGMRTQHCGGMDPHEYKIITVAIFGLGCLLTSVSAFMLSTTFRHTDYTAWKFMIVLTLLFLMGSLTLLLLATIQWIITDGWGIEPISMLFFALIFMSITVATFIGKLMHRCQHLWSNSWLPILTALLVQLTIITTVILMMKKHESSEEGCASEWPLIHRFLGALASPFILCLIVFTYRKLVDVIIQCQNSISQEDEESEEEHDKEEDEHKMTEV